MTKFNIIYYPNNILRLKAKPVIKFNQNLINIINDMLDTMFFYNGIGLAANQVNIRKAILVIKLDKKDKPLILINPKITSFYEKSLVVSREGCLSIPYYWGTVNRYKKIKVVAINQYNESLVFTAINELAICIQHEIDHLNGKLFIDYLTNNNRLYYAK